MKEAIKRMVAYLVEIDVNFSFTVTGGIDIKNSDITEQQKNLILANIPTELNATDDINIK